MGRYSVIKAACVNGGCHCPQGYLGEDRRGDGAALKKAIEAVLSDIELDVQYETAERSRTRG